MASYTVAEEIPTVEIFCLKRIGLHYYTMFQVYVIIVICFRQHLVYYVVNLCLRVN